MVSSIPEGSHVDIAAERAGDSNSTVEDEIAWWSRKVSYLDAKPEWECWSRNSPQLGYAVVSLVALLFYIPSAVLLAPFVTADSDGFFQPVRTVLIIAQLRYCFLLG